MIEIISAIVGLLIVLALAIWGAWLCSKTSKETSDEHELYMAATHVQMETNIKIMEWLDLNGNTKEER